MVDRVQATPCSQQPSGLGSRFRLSAHNGVNLRLYSFTHYRTLFAKRLNFHHECHKSTNFTNVLAVFFAKFVSFVNDSPQCAAGWDSCHS
jgi:hypothetical protein